MDSFDTSGEIGVVARAACTAAMRIAPAYAADGWQRQHDHADQTATPGVKIFRKAAAVVVRNATSSPFKAIGRVAGVEPMTLAMLVTEKLSDIKVWNPHSLTRSFRLRGKLPVADIAPSIYAVAADEARGRWPVQSPSSS